MKKALPFFLGLIVAATGYNRDLSAQTLEESLAAAYSNNPALLSQRAALRAVDEQVSQALSGWRPSVSVSSYYSVSETESNVRTSGTRVQTRHPVGAEFSVSQPVFNGFSTVAGTRKAENNVSAARARLAGLEQDVLLQAATAYVNVTRDKAVLELNISNEQVLRRQLEAAQDRFQVGELTRTDVSQAEARLAGARADRIQAEGNLEASRAAFVNVVGFVPEDLKKVEALGGLPESEKTTILLAKESHPQVVAASYDERAAQEGISQVRGELLPSINLNGTLSRDFETLSSISRTDEASVTASLTVPLYQSGAVYSRLRAAKQTAAQQRLSIETAQRSAVEKGTRAWEGLNTARARIVSFNAQIEAAQIALEGVEREAQVGSRTILDVLDAEQELLDARVSLVRAERDAVVASFQLKEAVGQLTAKELGLPVNLYDPGNHYREVRDLWFGGASSGDVDELDRKGERR